MSLHKHMLKLAPLGFALALLMAPLFAHAPDSRSAPAAVAPVWAAAGTHGLASDLLAPAGGVPLSSTPSYYFVAGNTFTPDGNLGFYTRQPNGCVSGMGLNSAFTAPVHLPQASQVVSLTLFSHDPAITTTTSMAYFHANDGQGSADYLLSASSQPNSAGYQQNTSAQHDPATIDNQNYSYYVQWIKTGSIDSPSLSLCGVRVTYYTPLHPVGYLPGITR